MGSKPRILYHEHQSWNDWTGVLHFFNWMPPPGCALRAESPQIRDPIPDLEKSTVWWGQQTPVIPVQRCECEGDQKTARELCQQSSQEMNRKAKTWEQVNLAKKEKRRQTIAKRWVTQLKMSEKIQRDNSPRKIYSPLIRTWKDAQYDRSSVKCTPKRQWDSPSRPLAWLRLKRQIITSVGKDTEKSEPTYVAGETVKWCSHFGKQSGTNG